jgi:hypothetical protein
MNKEMPAIMIDKMLGVNANSFLAERIVWGILLIKARLPRE